MSDKTLKTVKIDGMHCKACALGLEEALEKLDFIKAVDVNLENEQALIECTDKPFDMQQVKKVVEELNFQVIEDK